MKPGRLLNAGQSQRRKTAADTPSASGLPASIPVSVLAGSTLLGALLARDRAGPLEDRVRGGLKGLGTGTGLLGGVALADALKADGLGSAVGGVGGALAGHLAAHRLAELLGIDKRKPGVATLEGELLGKEGEAQPGPPAGTSPTLLSLLEAKAESDRRNYLRKHLILRRLLRDRPDDFFIDQDDGRGIVGLTHSPTGFRVHMPGNVLPGPVRRLDPVTKLATLLV